MRNGGQGARLGDGTASKELIFPNCNPCRSLWKTSAKRTTQDPGGGVKRGGEKKAMGWPQNRPMVIPKLEQARRGKNGPGGWFVVGYETILLGKKMSPKKP